MKSKDEFRKIIKDKREKLNLKEKYDLDKCIYNNIINSNYYNDSYKIFVYVSKENEIDTIDIIKRSIEDGKKIFVPKVISMSKGMEAVEINSVEELIPGAYNILEPKDFKLTTDPNDLDLILLPGAAFDLKGGRIGYGGGFYDRFLKRLKNKIPLIALAYEFQIFENVPKDINDVLINGIITDKSIHTIV